jgi:hypothetical protein
MVLFEYPYYIPVEPLHQQFGVGPSGCLPEVILITGGLAIILILVVEPRTAERHIPRLGVRYFVPHGGTKSIDHSARAHHVGKGMKLMDSMKPHRNITGNIYPKGHVVLLAR